MQARLLFNRKYIKWLIPLGFIIFGIIIRGQNLFHGGFTFDTITCFYTWGKTAYEQGFGHFWQYYSDFFDYLPGAVYYLMGIYKVSLLGGGTDINFVTALKLFNLGFDLVISTGIYYLMITRTKGNYYLATFVASLFWILPANWFISGVWGQLESVIMGLIVITLILLIESSKRNSSTVIMCAGIFFAIAFWIKLQTFLFFPIVGLLFVMINNWCLCRRFIVGFVLTSLIIVIPAVNYNPLRLGANLVTPFTRADNLSQSASNLWVFINNNVASNNRIIVQLPITYAMVAIITSGLIIGGLLIIQRKNIGWGKINWELFLFWGTIYLFTYFILMPKMYERYLYPGLVMIFLLIPFIKSIRNQRLIIITAVIANIGSFINLINIYYYWNYTNPDWVSKLWHSISLEHSRLAAGIILFSYIMLIVIYLKHPRLKSLKELLRT